MNEILLNMANILLLEYCGREHINASNSFVKKMGRGFTYGICDYPTGRVFAQVTFKKNAVPEYWWRDREEN